MPQRSRNRASRWSLVALVAALAMAGCATSEPQDAGGPSPPADSRPPGNSPSALPSAPWDQYSLASDDIPPIYIHEWRAAENRATCALMAPDSLGRGAQATPRSAQFAGGWAVAYDLPELRSAFGIAGTGTKPDEYTYDEWPYRRAWADGSSAGYGPEGGSGPNQLAYLEVVGQDCLYNVWSRLGVEHLEFLLEHLRFVDG